MSRPSRTITGDDRRREPGIGPSAARPSRARRGVEARDVSALLAELLAFVAPPGCVACGRGRARARRGGEARDVSALLAELLAFVAPPGGVACGRAIVRAGEL